MKTLSLQAVYNKVKKHLLKQGEKAADKAGVCQYRAQGGLKCALGCLIDDDVYTPSLEGDSLVVCGETVERIAYALKRSGCPTNKKAVRMLSRLQDVHDGTQLEHWKEGLRVVAKEFGLRP